MNTKFSLLKCFSYFNILYLQSIFNRYKKQTNQIEVKYEKLMYHHSTNSYLVFWNGKEFKRFLKKNVIEITAV